MKGFQECDRQEDDIRRIMGGIFNSKFTAMQIQSIYYYILSLIFVVYAAKAQMHLSLLEKE